MSVEKSVGMLVYLPRAPSGSGDLSGDTARPLREGAGLWGLPMAAAAAALGQPMSWRSAAL